MKKRVVIWENIFCRRNVTFIDADGHKIYQCGKK